MKPLVTLREALDDPDLLGGAIAEPSWATWRAVLIALMGEELLDEERELFATVTGREREPMERVDEFWAIVGRRGGKTRAVATLAAYIATLCDHSENLAKGERGVLPIMAASTVQGGRAFMHFVSVLEGSPELDGLIENRTADTIQLKTFVDVEVRPANFRTIRGVTSVAAIADEVAFWSIEGSANPDTEILEAVRPSLATTGGPLIVISSPYARRGELWNTFRRFYGPDGDPSILVAKGASQVFNPSLPQKVIDRAYARDAAVAGAEYGAEFRTDVEALLTREAIEAVIDKGCLERPHTSSIWDYVAFVDPSGGSSDSFTLAIAHSDGDRGAVLDATRETRPPFSPEQVVADYTNLLKSYGISRVYGDRYGGEFSRELFRKMGVSYEPSDKSKSELYRDVVPIINSKACRLLDDERLLQQLVGLERRTTRGGRDSIDHAPGGHDDLANAVAGALVRAHLPKYTYNLLNVLSDDYD